MDDLGSVRPADFFRMTSLKDFEACWVVAFMAKGKISTVLGDGEPVKIFDSKFNAEAWISSLVLMGFSIPGSLAAVQVSMVRDGSMWADYKAAPK